MPELRFLGSSPEHPLVTNWNDLEKIGIRWKPIYSNQHDQLGYMKIPVPHYSNRGVAVVQLEKKIHNADFLDLMQYQQLPDKGDYHFYIVPNTRRVLESLKRLGFDLVDPNAWLYVKLTQFRGSGKKIRTSIFLDELSTVLDVLAVLTNWSKNSPPAEKFEGVAGQIKKVSERLALAYVTSGVDYLDKQNELNVGDGSGFLFDCEITAIKIAKGIYPYNEGIDYFQETLSKAKAGLKQIQKEVQAYRTKSIHIKAKQQGYQDGYDDGIVACLEFKKEKAAKVALNPVLVGQALTALQQLFNYFAQTNFDPAKIGRSALRKEALTAIGYLKTIVDAGESKKLLDDLDKTLQALVGQDVIEEDKIVAAFENLNKRWNRVEKGIRASIVRWLMGITGIFQKPARILADQLG